MKFVKAVMILVSGTAVGHAVTAAALPLLTRLYSPDDFSILASFSALLAILSVSAGLRFDVAVSIPESDFEALNLLVLAVLSAATVALLLLSLFLGAPTWFAGILRQPNLAPYLWLLPIGVFLACSYSSLQFWFVRAKQFPLLARTRIAQSTLAAGTQLGFGLLNPLPTGLLLGYVMNSGAACLVLGPKFIKDRTDGDSVGSITRSSLKEAFRAHDRYPKFSTFEALCANAAISVPIILIAAFAAGPEAGYLILAISVMQAPMALVGVSIGQVYLSRATEEFRQGRLASFTTETVGGLVKTGSGPLLAAGILAPHVFGFIFGQGWERSGWLVAWMTPWFIMQFVASPISMALYVTKHQRAALLLQIFGLITRVGAVWLTHNLWPSRIAEAYGVSGLVFYGVYLALILLVTGCKTPQLLKAVRGAIPWSLGWCLAALAAALVLHQLRV